MKYSSFTRMCGLFALVGCLASTRPAEACSVCIAHALSAALHGVGAQTLRHNRVIVGITYTTFEKSNGTGVPGAIEKERFGETSLDASYGVSDRITLRGSLPFIDKRVGVTGMPAESSSGLGDLVLGATYQLPPALKSNILTAFSLDLKLPTGDNGIKDASGMLKEEHLQLGTGSVDVAPGFSVSIEGKRPGEIGYAGLRVRINGSNDRSFHYGDVIFYNLGWLRPLNRRTAFALEFNGRIADKDHQSDGTSDPDSGGHLAYISLSLRQDLGRDFGLIATYQQPVWKQLNGTQDEKALFSISLSKMF